MTDFSVDARLLASDRGLIPHINPAVVTFASALLAAGALALANAYTWRQGALFLLGGALGVALYHALFGLKILLALHVFAVAILIAQPGNTKRNRQMFGAAVSGLTVILISNYLKGIA